MATSALARVHHSDAWARQQFTKAERTREALNGRPARQRTRREYQRAIDAYRRVYFGSPTSSKADPSVVATAELMVEMGRRFDDDKILRGAVNEYRFLRKEYPGSKYRFDALFTIGEIYKDDLNDPVEARKTFEEFLRRYPRNRLAEDARTAVKEIDDAVAQAQEKEAAQERAAVQEKDRTARKGRASEGRKETRDTASSEASSGASNPTQAELPPQRAKPGLAGDPELRQGAHDELRSSAGAHELRRDELPRVTGVRHWSTPDYTRVAIDVEQEVKFSSQRIANPERIFFDIQGTKLASTLVGKTFDVDDGFLKKIRVAESKPGQTRIVLEVDDLASYDAFLLPDPYRLIIDVHGKESRAEELAKERSASRAAGGAAAGDGAASEEASAQSDEDEANDMTGERQGKVLSEKEHAIVAKVEPEKKKRDSKDPSEWDDGAERGPAGVTKTTVAVKGTDRRIPKTIVQPDDVEPNIVEATNVAPNNVEPKNDTSEKTAQSTRRKSKGTGQARPENAATSAETGAGEDDEAVEAQSRPGAGQSASGSLPPAKTARTRAQKSRGASARAEGGADLEIREARPTAAGNRSLTRALGLKIGKIVIDAGHGGHDTGTIGPNGLEEKDLVLDVAKRLGRLLEVRLGAEVIYTRRDDTFIPLETRTAIANRERADLFISIHANSSRDEDARGVETYYLNFTSSPDALEVAARENAVSEKSIHELQDLVKKIALKEKIDESREFASDVQDSLYGGLASNNAGIRNRGVKKAPFIVLIGANMPSILAEISFVSNPTDERKLETSDHRQRIAEALYRGVAKYASGLSGVKVASKIEKNEGQ